MIKYPNNERDIEWDVYCDGDLLSYCVLADDEYNVAICYALDAKGVPMCDPETLKDKLYLVTGKIEFKLTDLPKID